MSTRISGSIHNPPNREFLARQVIEQLESKPSEIVGESEGIPEIIASKGGELPPEKPRTLDTGRFIPVWFQNLE